MKHFFPLVVQFGLLAAVLVALLPSVARSQAPPLAVVGATAFTSLATPGQGSINDYELQEFTDAQGNTYQAGSFRGSVHFGPFAFTSAGQTGGSADYDVFVAKRNAAGTYEWAVAAGGLGEQRATALAVDALGNVTIAGNFDSRTATVGSTTLTNASPPSTSGSDIFVARLSPSGA